MQNFHDTPRGSNHPLALLADNLIIIPTPISVHSPTYRAFYASLHRDQAFCTMGFGEHFPARDWSDEETSQVIHRWDINESWTHRGIGDCAVGALASSSSPEAWARDVFGEDVVIATISGKQLISGGGDVRVVSYPADGPSTVAARSHEKINALEWVGYAGVREATEEHLRPKEGDDEGNKKTAVQQQLPPLPHWLDRVEVRYGVSPKAWGRGIASRAGAAVVAWAAAHRGVRTFIAETERANGPSARVLQKLGFGALEEAKYWGLESQIEWEKAVAI